jgi:GNAT superfamily N-acetyltransferase
MRAQEFISEISDEQLQRYLDRAGRRVDSRLERMSQARERLNKGYEIYHAETPDKIVHRFEANAPQEAQRYYADYIAKYESDVDYDLRLRRATGIMESTGDTMSTEDMIAYLRQHHDTNLHQDYLDHVNTFGKFVLKNVPLASIQTELSGLDRNKVEQYKKMDFSKAPPIVLGDGYILDGYHRATVAKALGIPSIRAYVGVKGVAEDTEDYAGLQLRLDIEKDDEYVDDNDVENQVIVVRAQSNGRELGQVLFTMDYDSQGLILNPQDLEVDERYRGQGIAQTMYDFVKSRGYRIRRSGQQTDAGAGFWDKHRPEQNVWEDVVTDLEKTLKEPHSYDAIDHMMQNIAREEGITAKELHDRFVDKHGMTPDDWIKDRLSENFADGKKPGRKGLSKRVGVNCKQSVSKLRSIAKNSSGEKQRMAHWCANMKSGRKK